MSLRLVSEIANEFPRGIRDDVKGYARSVSDALPNIFRDAGVQRTDVLGDQIVLIAAVKKLDSIFSSNYWTLDNSLRLLPDDVDSVRIGSTDLSRGSDYHTRMRELVRDFERLLIRTEVGEFTLINSYAEIARRLARGR